MLLYTETREMFIQAGLEAMSQYRRMGAAFGDNSWKENSNFESICARRRFISVVEKVDS